MKSNPHQRAFTAFTLIELLVVWLAARAGLFFGSRRNYKKHPAKFSVAGGGHPSRPNIMWIGPVELVE